MEKEYILDLLKKIEEKTVTPEEALSKLKFQLF